MAFSNILTRWLDREVLNFGFSGSCLMEAGVAQWLATIDAAAYVIDCSWNMSPDLIANRTVPLVRQVGCPCANGSVAVTRTSDATDALVLHTPLTRTADGCGLIGSRTPARVHH
jgi:hypothetical protein